MGCRRVRGVSFHDPVIADQEDGIVGGLRFRKEVAPHGAKGSLEHGVSRKSQEAFHEANAIVPSHPWWSMDTQKTPNRPCRLVSAHGLLKLMVWVPLTAIWFSRSSESELGEVTSTLRIWSSFRALILNSKSPRGTTP